MDLITRNVCVDYTNWAYACPHIYVKRGILHTQQVAIVILVKWRVDLYRSA